MLHTGGGRRLSSFNIICSEASRDAANFFPPSHCIDDDSPAHVRIEVANILIQCCCTVGTNGHCKNISSHSYVKKNKPCQSFGTDMNSVWCSGYCILVCNIYIQPQQFFEVLANNSKVEGV